MSEPEYDAFAVCWNDGRFFEAHEVLEGLWVRTRDRGQQGLIQLAAALYHVQRGNPRGARTMIDRALGRLTDPSVLPGPLDLIGLAAFARQVRAGIDDGDVEAIVAARPELRLSGEGSRG